MIRALVVDLDGTLIDRNEQVSPRVSQAVAQVARRIPVSIATGREPSDVIKFARQLSLVSPQICDGGATILDPSNGEHLWYNPLDPADAEQIVRQLDRMEANFIATHPGGSVYSISGVSHWNLTRVSALDLEEQAADTLVTKFRGAGETQAVKVYLPYNGLWAVDFTRKGVDKATAAVRLAGMLGVETEQMAAAGDSYNDTPLLRICGVAIAMGDAPEELKAIADYVAPPVEEDGLAVAIEEFLLPRLEPSPLD